MYVSLYLHCVVYSFFLRISSSLFSCFFYNIFDTEALLVKQVFLLQKSCRISMLVTTLCPPVFVLSVSNFLDKCLNIRKVLLLAVHLFILVLASFLNVVF